MTVYTSLLPADAGCAWRSHSAKWITRRYLAGDIPEITLGIELVGGIGIVSQSWLPDRIHEKS